MVEIKNVRGTDFDKIDIDSFWNVGSEKEHKGHRIHAYPAKFPAFITQKAIQYAISEGININTVADIFCGCGTVAFEAKRLGFDFWGCDLNPTAVLIAKAKSNFYQQDKIELYCNEIIMRFDLELDGALMPENINNRIRYWFFPKEILELSVMKKCINDIIPKKSKYMYFFLCAFSNILKPASKWLTKSIKPQIDPKKTPANVRTAFIAQCQFMKKAVENTSPLTSSRTDIKNQDASKIRKTDFVDLIITSPPYVTSYEYADLHQLSTLWLDYAGDYRDLRKGSIGSNHNISNDDDFKGLNEFGKTIVEELFATDRAKARAVSKYYYDMQNITRVCKSILKKNGMVLFVIGNTEYKGVRINNVMHLVESLNTSGFNSVAVTKRKISGKILTPYRDDIGRFSSSATSRKVYSEEFMVVGRS
jgi:DNA modification methylase